MKIITDTKNSSLTFSSAWTADCSHGGLASLGASHLPRVSGHNFCPLCGECSDNVWLRTPDRFNLRTKVYCLLKCPSCSLVWLKDPPKPDSMAIHYGKKYHSEIITSGENGASRRWREHITTLRRFKAPGQILDIGCSSGAFLNVIKNDGWQLYGIEIDPEIAGDARSRTGALVVSGDALSAFFPAGTFDAVTCFHALEHQHHPVELMTKVMSWLKPGGIFYVVVPNIKSWEARLFRSYWYGLEIPRHIFHFSSESLRLCGIKSGFQLEEMWTRSDCHIEASIQYVLNELRDQFHRQKISIADTHTPDLVRKIVRKGLRITVLAPSSHLAAMTGHGASISAVFKKSIT